MKFYLSILIVFLISACAVNKKTLEEDNATLETQIEQCRTDSEMLSTEIAKMEENIVSLETELQYRQETIYALMSEKESLYADQEQLAELYEENQILISSNSELAESIGVLYDSLSETKAYLQNVVAYTHPRPNSSSYQELRAELESGDLTYSNMMSIARENINGSRATMNSLRNQPSDTVDMLSIFTGNVAIYCPEEMTYKETYDVKSIIPDLLSDEAVRKSLVSSVMDHNPELDEEEIDDQIIMEEIQYHNLVELELREVKENSFTINPMHTDNRQKVDANMRGWHWKVTPISEEPNQQLYLDAHIFDSQGKRLYRFDKTFKIEVTVDLSGFWNKASKLILEDPKWAIVTLIIPFLTYIAGFFTPRKNERKAVG